MRGRRMRTVALVAAGALLLAACGDDSDGGDEEGSGDETTTTTEAVTTTTEAPADAVDPADLEQPDTAPFSLVADPGEGIADGDTLSVELGGFAEGAEITVVTCFVFPATGPESCDLSNYGDFVVTADADGGGALDYEVKVGELDGGTCDASTPCYIVAGDGFGPDANYAAQLVTFA